MKNRSYELAVSILKGFDDLVAKAITNLNHSIFDQQEKMEYSRTNRDDKILRRADAIESARIKFERAQNQTPYTPDDAASYARRLRRVFPPI